MAKILIVDDSKFMRKMLTDILSEDKHKIVGEAENALEAVQFCKNLKPDLVTLDIIMPIVEGVDTLAALKKIVNLKNPANIIMISTMGQEQIMEDYLEAGAKDFIIKPFQPEDILSVVNKVLTDPGK